MGNYYSKASDFNISGEALGGGGGGGGRGGGPLEAPSCEWDTRLQDHQNELIIIEGYGHSPHVSC